MSDLFAVLVGVLGVRDEQFEGRIDRLEEPTCYEDDPCWECETVGNLVCGVEP